MDERVVKFRVGVMVLATLIIVAILVLLFGELPTLLKSTYTVFIEFPEAPGVTQDTAVRKSGILIGRVTDVHFSEDDPKAKRKGGVVVKVSLNSDVKLRRNEVCRISGSLLGDAVLQFIPVGPMSKEFIQDGDYVAGTVAGNPLQVLSSLESGLNQAIGSVSNAGTEVGRLAQNLNNLLDNNDEQINRIVNKTERTLDDFQAALANANSIFGDEESRTKLQNSMAQLPEIIQETRAAMTGIQSAVGLANRNLANLEGFTGPLGERGPEIVSKVDQSVGRLDELLIQFVEFGKAINRREGSFGQLVNNPELYQHLNAAACNIEQLTRELRPIIRDARVVSDKLARDPGIIGVRGALKRDSGLIK